ncbi:MAG: bacteriohemerythrin [Treponema sp.]
MATLIEYNWHESLSVGYCYIDLHHKKLLLIIKKFGDLLKQGQKNYAANIGKILKELSDYTWYHFSEEEKIISKFQCPFFEEHAKIHAEFIEKINAGLKTLASGDMEAGLQFHNFLGKWLTEHIAVTDHKWSGFVHENYPDADF